MVFTQVEIHRQLAEVYEARVFLRKGSCGFAAVLYVMAGEMLKGICDAESKDVHGG
jgi:hypothetical protein